jgi:hypothetical protein
MQVHIFMLTVVFFMINRRAVCNCQPLILKPDHNKIFAKLYRCATFTRVSMVEIIGIASYFIFPTCTNSVVNKGGATHLQAIKFILTYR